MSREKVYFLARPCGGEYLLIVWVRNRLHQDVGLNKKPLQPQFQVWSNYKNSLKYTSLEPGGVEKNIRI